MSYKGLYVFVEGIDDERFFDRILRKEFEKKYYFVKTIKYACLSKDNRKKLINGINNTNSDYIFMSDLDNVQCITSKKDKLLEQYSFLLANNIIIVVKEIESWYLSGLDDINCRKLKIPIFNNTDNITKEDFNTIFNNTKIDSKLEFLFNILECFSIEIGKRKNKSFNYFVNKYY